MTGSNSDPRVPGATLIKIARLLFSDYVISAVVLPAISDLQCEIADAGQTRLGRLRARWRGYGAFWRLTLVVPFTRWPAPAGNAGTATFPDVVGRLAVGSAAVILLAVVRPVLGVWFAFVAAAVAAVALVIHSWYVHHPSDIPDPIERSWRTPQINISSTEVPANSGGLIFVIGSVFIVAIGLPSAVWFLLIGAAGGCVVAWVLLTRRRVESPRHLLTVEDV